MSKTSEYKTYAAAKNRCTNPNDLRYSDYGGRGIKFLFDSFEQFFLELGKRPKNYVLDRLDNDKGYEIGNLAWVTRSASQLNQRKRKTSLSKYKYVTFDKAKSKWLVQFRGKFKGHFDTEYEAGELAQRL